MENNSVVFEDHLSKLIKATDEAMDAAAEIIGGMAETHAKEYITEAVYETPEGWYVRTGNLRNSIAHETEEPHTVVIGSTVKYAPYVELGTGIYNKDGRKTPWRYQDAQGNWHITSGMPARPFIRPALENHLKEYKQVFNQVLKDMK